VEKILIINPFGIGDVLFTTPVIRALKERYPDSFIGYWCNERVGGLLKSDTDINKVFDLSRGDIKRVYKGFKRFAVLFNLIRQIRAEGFNTAFDFSLDSRYGMWSKLAGINRRIGFDYKNRGRFLTDKVELKGYAGRHVVEYYADLLKFLGIEPREKMLSLNVTEENKAKARGKLLKLGIDPLKPIVGIAMGGGASWGKDAFYKQWSAKKFAQLANMLINDFSSYIILLGSSDEKPLADTILNEVKNKNVADLTGELSLEELAAVIKELKLLICNDGGPLHMAVSLCVSTVSMFGPVDDLVYGPYPPCAGHIVVKVDLSCRPCYKDFRFKECSNNRHCLEDITVDEVYDKVKTLL
jgi:lipopolysaccharide heptosyltransferase II